MIEEKHKLADDVYLQSYVIERSNYIQSGKKNTWQPEKRPAIIILPGGGYNYIADSENEPIVFHFLARGYSVFSLHYSVGERSEYPGPLIEVFRSIKYVKENADRFWIDSSQIVLCGFSAGAHLAGLAATQYMLREINKIMNVGVDMYKPNAVILCYPITNVTRLHDEIPNRVKTWGSMLSNQNEKADVVKYISKDMCPTFLWHTRTDGIVPVTQSLEMIEVMQDEGVDFECHIFCWGYHGLSSNDVLSNYKGAIQNGEVVPNVDKWIELASNWINYLFNFNV